MFELVPPPASRPGYNRRMNTAAGVLLKRAEYDIATAPELEDELSALNSGMAVIDFAQVSYIDSSALALLIATLKRMKEKDPQSTLVLRNTSPAVRRLFELTNLTRLFLVE